MNLSKILYGIARRIDPATSANARASKLPFSARPDELESTPYDYAKYRSGQLREEEHQVGRLKNFIAVFKEISERKLAGDVVEFGCWRGASLVWMAKLRSFYKIQGMRIVGVDGFEGLPEESTIWTKGAFSNTSAKICADNLKKYLDLSESGGIEIVQGFFAEQKTSVALRDLRLSPILFHLDADLGSSTRDALSVVSEQLETNPVSYLLFDDWGCHQCEVPDAFYNWYLPRISKIRATVIATTYLTRYYRIERI